MSSDEEDFMSDAFLANLEKNAAASSSSSSKPKTYQESRRQALLAQEKKNKANALKPYRQREEEARQQGMAKNLFERELERDKDGTGSTSKAMGMMLKMGYKVGDGLGKKRTVDEDSLPSEADGGRGGGGTAEAATSVSLASAGPSADAGEEESSSGGGIGSAKRRRMEDAVESVVPKPKDAPSSGHRFEPIAVSFRAGRKGLGSRAPPPPPAPVATTPVLDPSAYRSRAAIEYAEKKAEGQLGAARRTVVELDERENRGFSILHLNPHYLPSFPEPLLQHLTGHAPSSSSSRSPPPPPIAAFEDEANIATAELLKRQMQSDSLASILTIEQEEDEVGGLGDASRGNTRDGQEDEDKPGPADEAAEEDWEVLAGEARKFIGLPATERLCHTLQYLREEFHYCLYCGVEYRSADELESDCPGLVEDDH